MTPFIVKRPSLAVCPKSEHGMNRTTEIRMMVCSNKPLFGFRHSTLCLFYKRASAGLNTHKFFADFYQIVLFCSPGINILVATPGRLLDHLQVGVI